jgi:uncharacterized protein
MALGPFQFEAHGFGFNARRKFLDTPWAELPIAGGENQLQWLGTRGRGESIRGVLFKSFGGQASLEGLKIAARNGLPLPFVDLAGFPSNVLGIHVVEEVSEDHTFVDRGGSPLRNAYYIAIRSAPLDLSGFGSISVSGRTSPFPEFPGDLRSGQTG